MLGRTLKPCGYRLACGGVVVGFIQFVVGFGLPSWKRDDKMTSGLWQTCTTTMESCRPYYTDKEEGWLDTVRALEVLALALFCASVVILWRVNCSSRHLYVVKCDSCGLPSVCICTGVIGLSGAIVFTVCEASEHMTFSSGLYLVIVGSVFALFCGVQLTCFSSDVLEDVLEEEEEEHRPQPAVYYTPDTPVFVIPRQLRATDSDVFY